MVDSRSIQEQRLHAARRTVSSRNFVDQSMESVNWRYTFGPLQVAKRNWDGGGGQHKAADDKGTLSGNYLSTKVQVPSLNKGSPRLFLLTLCHPGEGPLFFWSPVLRFSKLVRECLDPCG